MKFSWIDAAEPMPIVRVPTERELHGKAFAPVIYVFVLAIGLAAGTLSGVIGTGSTIMLLPILVYQYGPKQAVPIMAISALMSNIVKISVWWRSVNWRSFLRVFNYWRTSSSAWCSYALGLA